MGKVIFTADTLMTILRGVFDDNDLDTIVESDRVDWKGKKLSEVLNIDYYTHKHVAPTTEDIKNELMAKGADNTGQLDVLKRSFCLISLEELQRLYSKDIDQIAVRGTMQFWLQAEKVKLLEAFIETANIALCGEKITIVLQGETRKATLFFGGVEPNIEGQTEIGESAVATISVDLMLTPNVASYSDYKVSFMNDQGETAVFQNLPVTSFSYTSTMAQRAVPFMSNPLISCAINQSNILTFVLGFDGDKNNPIIAMFTKDTFSRGSLMSEGVDNNKVYTMQINRDGEKYSYNVKIKEHSISVNNSTGNETHKLILTTGD